MDYDLSKSEQLRLLSLALKEMQEDLLRQGNGDNLYEWGICYYLRLVLIRDSRKWDTMTFDYLEDFLPDLNRDVAVEKFGADPEATYWWKPGDLKPRIAFVEYTKTQLEKELDNKEIGKE